MSSDDKPWSCSKCTYINTPITLACLVCGGLQDGTVGTARTAPVPVPTPTPASRAKSPAKTPAKTGTTPPAPVAPVPSTGTVSTPPIGFKLPIKARLDSTVRQFQLDRWIYSSLVETTQRLFNITQCSLFYDDEPKGGAPNLVPIRNDIDFTAAVNASHAANRRTLKIVITVPPPTAATSSPPLGPAKTSHMNIPTSASLFTPKPPSSTPPVGLVPVQQPAPSPSSTTTPTPPTVVTTLTPSTNGKPNPAPSPSPTAAVTPAAPPTTTPIISPSPSPSPSSTSTSSSSPSPSRVSTPVVDPHAATAGEPTTRRISSSIPPRWRHTIDVVPRFALSNENASPTAGATVGAAVTPTPTAPAAADATTANDKEIKQDNTKGSGKGDAITTPPGGVTVAVAATTTPVSLPVTELARTRSSQDDWEEVAAIGQWSALERGIRSIRSDVIIWQSATLLPSPADPKRMRVVALAGSSVLPDELLADIQKLHEVVSASLLEFAEEDPLAPTAINTSSDTLGVTAISVPGVTSP